MASKVLVRRHIGGTQAAPTGANIEGDIAVFFPGAAGDTTKPTIYLNDGGGWREANPDAQAPTVGNAQLTGGTPGSQTGIGAAWTALTPKPTDPIVIASFAGSAYVRTGAGGADGDWTSLGSATSWATAGDIHAGTNVDKALNSAILRGEALNAPSTGTAAAADADRLVRLDANGLLDGRFIVIPYATQVEVTAGTEAAKAVTPATLRGETLNVPSGTPANDANKLVRLDAAGLIDSGFLNIPAAFNYLGNQDFTSGTLPTTPASGDFVTNSTKGATNAAWAFPSGVANVEVGDSAFFDGTAWHHLAATVDMTPYLLLAGGTMVAAASVAWPGAATAEAGNVLLDLKGGTADNVLIDCGTY